MVSWADEPCDLVREFVGSGYSSGTDCGNLFVSGLHNTAVESAAIAIMAVVAAVGTTNSATMQSGDSLTAVESWADLKNAEDVANPHYVLDPLPQPLCGHRSTGQLRTLIQRVYLEDCKVSRLASSSWFEPNKKKNAEDVAAGVAAMSEPGPAEAGHVDIGAGPAGTGHVGLRFFFLTPSSKYGMGWAPSFRRSA